MRGRKCLRRSEIALFIFSPAGLFIPFCFNSKVMKKFLLLPITFILCSIVTLAQKPGAVPQAKPVFQITERKCATMDKVAYRLQHDPVARAIANSKPVLPVLPGGATTYRTAAIVTIPVVVHIVMGNPYLVTDADVASQIARLNLDFSGLNPDSTNSGTFQSVRGHSQIRFTLARRTPAGQLTNGIERRVSGTGSNANLATDPIKFTAQGGLDVWDPNSYLNLWIGNDNSGDGILGYAQFPGTGPANEDGVFLNVQSFGEATCSNVAVYNRGRTGTHEVGHYLGLFHIWGDEDACVGDDFENLTAAGSTCVLPARFGKSYRPG